MRAGGVKMDIRALKSLRDRLGALNSGRMREFNEEMVRELAARLLRKVIRLTPVGQYETGSGKVGGTLRRGWVVGDVTRNGDDYNIDVLNPVDYSIYVEHGHRTRDGKGWVEGRFMMTVSLAELREDAERIIERKLTKFLAGGADA